MFSRVMATSGFCAINSELSHHGKQIETNSMVAIGRECHYISADGMLVPVRKGQRPPDLRYFKDSSR
jgi:hypothetical protein